MSAEKRAVGDALAILAYVSPAALARAMGIAPSTLYAYADPARATRPGPKRLYQAAHMMRLCARELDAIAEAVTDTARSAEPAVRGKSGETLPIVG